MDDDEEVIDDIFDRHSLDKGDMEAAVELGRLVAEETALCCEDLGHFIWNTYRQLQEKGGE